MSYWSPRAQKLFNHLRTSVPRFLFQKMSPTDEGGQFGEIWGAIVRIFDNVQAHVDYWYGQSLIKQSSDIWLNQHAIDRGSNRQDSENDASVIERITTVEEMVTRPAVQAKAQAIMTALGAAGSPVIVELRIDADRAYASSSGYLISTGFAISYLARGFRLSSSGGVSGFIVILPFGTSNSVRDAVDEYVKRYKGAGIFHRVEVRAVP